LRCPRGDRIGSAIVRPHRPVDRECAGDAAGRNDIDENGIGDRIMPAVKALMQWLGRRGETRHLLMPLPPDKVRALSLQHHLALETVTAGSGSLDQVGCLVRAVYLAFFLRDTTSDDATVTPFRRAEHALHACVARVDNGACCRLVDHEPETVARILLIHDRQLATVTGHLYLAAAARLRHHLATGRRSPIALAACR
jgi:hypothetical protein